jgi:hypothetical protein
MDKNIKGLKGENTNKVLNVHTQNENDIISFLDEKQNLKHKDAWSKLDKTTKIAKVCEYIENKFSSEQSLNNVQVEKCNEYLLDTIDKKRLNKNKDVIYKDGTIMTIINFSFNKLTNKALLSGEKRASTLRNLPDFKKISKKHNKTKSGNDCPQNNGKKIIIKDTIDKAE